MDTKCSEDLAKEKLEAVKGILDEQDEGRRKVLIRRATVSLNCCEKTILNYVQRYMELGEKAFIHGNKGKKPATTYPEDVKESIVNLYRSTFYDASISHYSEILEENNNLVIPPQTIRRWLREAYIASPKSRKKTKKKMRELLDALASSADASSYEKEIANKELIALEEKDAHPRRPRSKYFGELIQMDASSYKWNGSVTWHLHVAIDDATGHIVGAWFDTEETLNGYYHVFEQILRNYGIPVTFYTDRRTVFEYERKDKEHKNEEKDTFTQFSAACRALGTEIKTTSVPQAKGRVERSNGTLQSRLPVELRMNGIITIEDANDFLVNTFINKYNSRFSLLDDKAKSTSTFITGVSDETINTTLAVISERVIDTGNAIKYHKKYYFPIDKDGNKRLFKKGTKTLIISAYDGNLYCNIDDEIYALEEALERATYSKNFDPEPPKEKKKKPYIPSQNHPWRRSAYSKRWN